MGYPRSDAEKTYLDEKLGNRWPRLLSNGQIFNRFADYAAYEAKIDRDKIVKRLRVFSSRDEDPTAFWTVLMMRFYEEAAHLGLRKYSEAGVTYYCPPHLFADFKALCQSTPSFKTTTQWVFRPDYLSGWIFAHVFSAGDRNWYNKSWPNALILQGQRYLVTYYPAGSVNEILDSDQQEFDEASLESYRSSHSLLCLIFGTKSAAAFDISIGSFAATKMLEVVKDPYLGISSNSFEYAATSIAGLCTTKGKLPKNSVLQSQVQELLQSLSTTYIQLQSAMVEDADYMYPVTYPLMPLSRKANYGALLSDFEAGMKTIVVQNAEEIEAAANNLQEEEDVILHNDPHEPDRVPYPDEVVRQYLIASQESDFMSLEAFDALLYKSQTTEGKASEIVRLPSLKKVLSDQSQKLTETVEETGAFPITDALLAALVEVGQARCEIPSTDYGNLLYRTKSECPWLRTPIKLVGDIKHLEDTLRELSAFCRIVTGR